MYTLLSIISKLVSAAIKVETLLVTLVLGVFPLGGLLLQPLESRYPANPALTHVDGIVILGGGEDGSKSRFWGQVQ